MAKKVWSYNEIIKSVEQRQFAPVYLLMGEESYYIDQIVDAIDRTVLTEDEKSFNQMTVYCTHDTKVGDVINMAKRYPMMSEYQVVLVKEAQNLQHFEDLNYYVQSPLPSTILVISYKNGNVDKRKKVVASADKVGVVFESPKLRDSALPSFIDDYLASGRNGRKCSIAQDAKMIMVQYIGADLSRMAGELDKLCITMPEGEEVITADLIEKNIGISKEFNNWELRAAIIKKDVYKANQIIAYFNDNPKNNPPIVTVSLLFSLFAGVMQAYYSPDKSQQGLMAYLDLHQPWQLNDYLDAMRNYSAMKTMRIISKLRETDAKLKGVNKGNTPDSDILKELLFFILH